MTLIPRTGLPELVAECHDLSAFASGEPTLDDWLRRRARANLLSGASRTYVRAPIRSLSITLSLPVPSRSPRCPGRVRRNLPDPIPMAVLGRFAVDQAWQGRGLGRLLLRDALLRTCQAAAIVPVRGILVHALSPPARRFYDGYGSRKSPENSRTLLVSVQAAPLRCGMYKPKTPLPAPGFLRLCIELSRGRLAPEQAQPGSRRDLPRRLLATSPDPAAKV